MPRKTKAPASAIDRIEAEWLATLPLDARKLVPSQSIDNDWRGEWAAGRLAAVAPAKSGPDEQVIAQEDLAVLHRRLTPKKRRDELRRRVEATCGAMWEARFDARPAWELMMRTLESRIAWLQRHGKPGVRRVSTRTALVVMLDTIDLLGVGMRDDGSARFLTVTEKTIVSLLIGHWPETLPRRAEPEDVFRAERAIVDQAQRRHPLPAMLTYEPELGGWREHPVRRGKQAEDARRRRHAEIASGAGDVEKYDRFRTRLTREPRPKR